MRSLIPLYVAFLILAGCGTTPEGQQISETGKVAIQATARIAVRHYVDGHPGRSAEIVANVRDVAALLAGATGNATVSGLRVVVEAEIVRRVTDSRDLQDAHDLLDVFEALLREQIGKDEIDSQALIRVSEFADMIVKALPAAPAV